MRDIVGRGRRTRAWCLALASLVAAFSATAIATAPVEAAGLVSGFGNGMQGWTCDPCEGGSGSLVYSASGGNPGGYVTFVDGDSGSNEVQSFFLSPSAWAGNRSTYYNGTLSFDLRLNGAADSGRAVIVVLQDLTFGAVVAGPVQVPTTSWASFTMPLSEAPGWVSFQAIQDCAGNQACINSIPRLTRSQVKSLLADLDSVAIVADYQAASGERTDLDNVALEPPTVAPRTLTIGYKKAPHTFKGRLTAAQAGCAADQSVSVYRVKTGPDQRVGTAKTTATGAWTLTHSATPGSYYAVAARSNLEPGTDCGVATSSRLAVSSGG